MKKNRQIAANKQTFDLNLKEKLKLRGKLVKTLKINKLLILIGKIEFEKKTRQKVKNKQTFDFDGKK